jgi:hypothetical protein
MHNNKREKIDVILVLVKTDFLCSLAGNESLSCQTAEMKPRGDNIENLGNFCYPSAI